MLNWEEAMGHTNDVVDRLYLYTSWEHLEIHSYPCRNCGHRADEDTVHNWYSIHFI